MLRWRGAQWEIPLSPADDEVELVETGPCTLVLSLPAYGHKVTAYGCWIGDGEPPKCETGLRCMRSAAHRRPRRSPTC